MNIDVESHAVNSKGDEPTETPVEEKNLLPNVQPFPPRLFFVTWNLDGLDEDDLMSRTVAVVNKIRALAPDVIFFQEVIALTANHFDRELPEYEGIRGGCNEYFTMTLIRVSKIKVDSHKNIPFPGSKMGRSLLVCNALVGKRKFAFLNSHLESTRNLSEERKAQLEKAFTVGATYPPEVTVIFGGDLNLRDYEEYIPDGFSDVWKMCGAPENAKYTWDLTKNTNKSGFGLCKPRLRFDRVYFRPEQGGMVKPLFFSLIGMEPVPGVGKYPSDHWGIAIMFDMKH